MSYFAFVLANVDADRQLGSDLATVLDDLDWAIVVGVTYWVNALVTRVIVIDPGPTADEEFRIQHARAQNVLAVAVLVGGAVVVVRQTNGYDASAWSVMGPLLAIRAMGDLHARLKGASRYTPPRTSGGL